MKKSFLFLLVALAFWASCTKDRDFLNAPPTSSTPVPKTPTDTLLFLNEFMADNGQTLANPDTAGYPDWIEIYNAGLQAIDLKGFYVSDDSSALEKYQIPAGAGTKTIVPSKGYLVIFADGYSNLGALHANFSLSKSGEMVVLTNPSGKRLDFIKYGAQSTDVSYGRYPDGASFWKTFSAATPGRTNQ